MISLRDATPADQELLEYWDQKPHVIACDPEGCEDWESELNFNPSWRKQLVAMINDRPIGFIQIINPAQEESHYWGVMEEGSRAIDIWIGEERDLGKGYGTQMMHQALDLCFEASDVEAVLVDPLMSNVEAHHFYEQLGFQFVEEREFGNDRCKVYQLNRDSYIKKGL